MKKLLLLICITAMLVSNIDAQITSLASGEWNTAGTWSTNAVPTATDNVVIDNNHAITLTTTAGACASLTMNAGSTLTLNGALALPGTTRTLDASSTVIYNGSQGSFAAPVTYGNLTWNSSGSGNPGANSITVAGNLTISSGTVRGLSATTGSNTHTVSGNVNISGAGRISGVNSTSANSGICIWNIAGNLTMADGGTGRLIVFESAGANSGTSTFNIGGNLYVGTGNTVQLRSSSTAVSMTGTGTISVKGNVTNAANSITSASATVTGSCALAFNLNGTSAQTWSGNFPGISASGQSSTLTISNSAGVTLSSAATIASNSLVNVASGGVLNLGTNVVSSTGSFSVSSGGTISCGHANGVNGNITTTGAGGGGNAFNTAGNYIFNGSSAQVTGTLLPATVNNLTINNSAGVALSQGTTVNGTITLQSGNFDNSVNSITLGPSAVVTITGGTSSVALPVELTSFTASVRGKKVELLWNTATEVNNAGFSIERRTSTGAWSAIGFVEGNGTVNTPKSYRYTDNLSSAATYQYRLKQIDRDGKFEYSPEIDAVIGMTADDYQLSQNYPNPFNPSTTISFAVKAQEHVTVKVFNLIGQEVATLFNDAAEPNQIYTMKFDGTKLSSGLYVYTLRSGSRNETRKMLLTK